jgi:hypothetical protein
MKNTTLDETEQFLIEALKRNVHVWKPGKPRKKPHMRDTIKRERAGSTYRIVTVPTKYAVIENARPGEKQGYGTHNFGDKSEQETIVKFRPIITRRINEILQKHGSGVVR